MLRLLRPRCRDLVLEVHLVASPPCSKTCQSICALHNTTIKEPRRTYKLTENGKRYKGSFSILHWSYESMLVRFSEKIKLDIANCMRSQTCGALAAPGPLNAHRSGSNLRWNFTHPSRSHSTSSLISSLARTMCLKHIFLNKLKE